MVVRTGNWPFAALALAGLLGACGVAVGAWAAHGIDAALGARAALLVRTALPWQMWHVMALAIVAVWRLADPASPARQLAAGAFCFAVGTLFFCGALYAAAVDPMGPLRHLAPFGGLLLLGGWLFVAAAAGTRLLRH